MAPPWILALALVQTAPDAPCALRRWTAEERVEGLGGAAARLDDWNGDRVSELLVTSWVHAWVVSGADGSPLRGHQPPAGEDSFLQVAAVGDLDGDERGDYALVCNPFQGHARIHFISGASGAHLGAHEGQTGEDVLVSALDDLDGDGRVEVLVRFPGEADRLHLPGSESRHPPPPATVQVLSYGGGGLRVLRRIDCPAREPELRAAFGAALAAVGDLDRDVLADVALAAPVEPRDPWEARGRVWALSSRDGSVLWTVEGERGTSVFGTCLTGGADLDQDGTPDVVIGSRARPEGRARIGQILVRAVSGVDGATLHEHAPPSLEPLVFVGDVDADGVPDLASGTYGFPTDRVQLHAGRTAKRLAILDPWSTGILAPSADDTHFWSFGASLVRTDDVDGDGVADLGIGWQNDGRPGEPGGFALVSGATREVLYEVRPEALAAFARNP